MNSTHKLILSTFLIVFTSFSGFSQVDKLKTRLESSEKESKVFWKWFKANNTLTKEGDLWKIDTLDKKLYQYKAGISYSINELEDQRKELLLSCGGNKELVPFMEILNNNKPKIKNWVINTYLPTAPIPDSLRLYDLDIAARDLEIYLAFKSEQLYIFVGLKREIVNTNTHSILIHEFIQCSLGEENILKHIGSIKTGYAHMAPEDLIPINIYELKSAFNAYYPHLQE